MRVRLQEHLCMFVLKIDHVFIAFTFYYQQFLQTLSYLVFSAIYKYVFIIIFKF